MSAWARRRAALACAFWAVAGLAATAQTSDLTSKTTLRVCADPAARPASMQDGGGYENKIAELLAEELGRPLEYTWYPMSTGFIRNTLGAKKCDVVIGYAQGHEMVLNTNHYLTSTYMLIARADSDLSDVEELSDPRLKGRRIGVIAGSPPATHMARHGLLAGVKGYPLHVDRRYDSPVDDMLADLDAGTIDAGIVWGPLGGPLSAEHPDLVMTPLVRETMQPRLNYRITMGVRQGEDVWKRELNSLIRRNQDKIDAILREAGVPLLTDMGTELKPEG